MTKPIGFLAFLKLLQLQDRPRKTELKKKLGGGGGFQYWRPVQIVAPKALLPAANIEYLKNDIDALCSGHQRKYNRNAFAVFAKWIQGKRLTAISHLPTLDAPLGDSGLVIRLKPEISFSVDGEQFSMNLWATTKPQLTTPVLSAGLHFLKDAYDAAGHSNRRHLVFDTISNKIFREQDISPFAAIFLKAKIEAFKKDWEDLNSSTPPSQPDATDHPPQL